MNENEFFDALRELSKEKNIELNCLIEKVKTAMALVAKKEFGGAENVFVTIN
ncbi:MAG: NusA N-terminal domain-containing protein, partial [Oscillospiraceae bacterium]